MDEQQNKGLLTRLRIMLVLSMIGSGFSILNNLLTGITLPMYKRLWEEGALSGPLKTICDMTGTDETLFYSSFEQMLQIPAAYYFLTMFLYAMSLAGVIMMWRMRKNGFHFYSIAQLLLIIVSILFLGKASMSIGNLMITALFIGFYFVALKGLGLFQPPTEKTEPENDDSTTTNE